MSRTRAQLIVQTVWSAASSISLQAIAILSLTPVDYGRFSLLFIGFAWFVSLTFSIVSEPWLREGRATGARSPWLDYASVAVVLALLCGLPSILVGALIGDFRTAVLSCRSRRHSASIASLTLYEVVARSRPACLDSRCTRSHCDGCCLVARGGSSTPLNAVAVGWLAASTTASLASRLPATVSLGSLPRWFRKHTMSIRVLLADSIIQDVSTFVLPFVFAPVMGLSASVLPSALKHRASVRVILVPLRPAIGARPYSYFGRTRTLVGALAGAIGAALATSAALWLIAAADST